MKQPLNKSAICFLLAFVLILPTVLAGQVGSGHVLISPHQTLTNPGDTFSIFLGVDTVKLVKDFLIDIEVDTNIIRLDSVMRVSSFFTGPNGAFIYWKDTVHEFVENESTYVYEILGSIIGPGNFVDGPGNMVRLKCTAQSPGISPVAFRYHELRDTLIDPFTHMGGLIELQGGLDGVVIVCPESQELILAEPLNLSFNSETGQGNPAPQMLTINNPCMGNLNWTAVETAEWLSLDSYAGSSPSELTILADISGMAAGMYRDSIRFYSDEAVNSPISIPVTLELTSSYLCGDANADGSVNVSDAVRIINFVFIGGQAPDPLKSGDANCDVSVNVSDAVWIINYVFIGGKAPCDTDGDGEPDC